MPLRITFPAGHPAFAGHFPGRPVLPAVVLLDAVLHAAPRGNAAAAPAWHIGAAKFLRPVGPEQELQIDYKPAPGGVLQFEITHAGQLVAQGTLLDPTPPEAPAHAGPG